MVLVVVLPGLVRLGLELAAPASVLQVGFLQTMLAYIIAAGTGQFRQKVLPNPIVPCPFTGTLALPTMCALWIAVVVAFVLWLYVRSRLRVGAICIACVQVTRHIGILFTLRSIESPARQQMPFQLFTWHYMFWR